MSSLLNVAFLKRQIEGRPHLPESSLLENNFLNLQKFELLQSIYQITILINYRYSHLQNILYFKQGTLSQKRLRLIPV